MGGLKMKRIITNIKRNMVINTGYDFSKFMNKYDSDIRFIKPWVQNETKQDTNFKESLNTNQTHKKKFIEFIEANNFM